MMNMILHKWLKTGKMFRLYKRQWFTTIKKTNSNPNKVEEKPLGNKEINSIDPDRK